jgi:hypothetical protein
MVSPWDCVREASVRVWLVCGVLDVTVILHHRHFSDLRRSNSEFGQISTGAVPYNCSIKNLENVWGYISGYILYPGTLGTLKLSLTAVKQGVNFFFRIRVLALYNIEPPWTSVWNMWPYQNMARRRRSPQSGFFKSARADEVGAENAYPLLVRARMWSECRTG